MIPDLVSTNIPNTGSVTGFQLSQWSTGKIISNSVAIVVRANSGATTLPATQYDIDYANGRILQRQYQSDDDQTVVDWTSYGFTNWDVSYGVYDPTTQLTTSYVHNTETYTEITSPNTPFDPYNSTLNLGLVAGLVVNGQQFSETISSDNFVTGVSGWQILRNGNAEFNSVAVRLGVSSSYIVTGGGEVTLDENGITILAGTGTANTVQWKDGGVVIAATQAEMSGGISEWNFNATGKDGTHHEASIHLTTETNDAAAHAGTAIVELGLETADSGATLTAGKFIVTGSVKIGGSYGDVPVDSLDVTTATSNQGARMTYTGASSASVASEITMVVNDGSAMASSDRLGQFLFAGYNGTSVVGGPLMLARTTELWSGTARGSKIEFYTVPNTTTGSVLALTLGQDQSANHAGIVYVNDTSNANMTLGVTINQGANDDEALTIKSSDVAHGVTTVTETDSYATFKKFVANNGGLDIIGLDDTAGTGMRLAGVVAVANGTHTTAAKGAVMIDGFLASGTGVTALGGTNNLLVIRDNGTAEFIFDASGAAWENTGTAWTNFDEHDDLALLNLLSAHITRANDPLRESFGGWLSQNRAELEALRLVQFDESGNHFVNMSRLTMLLVGAVRQLGAKQEALP